MKIKIKSKNHFPIKIRLKNSSLKNSEINKNNVINLDINEENEKGKNKWIKSIIKEEKMKKEKDNNLLKEINKYFKTEKYNEIRLDSPNQENIEKTVIIEDIIKGTGKEKENQKEEQKSGINLKKKRKI